MKGRLIEVVMKVTFSGEDPHFALGLLGVKNGRPATTVSYNKNAVALARATLNKEKFDKLSNMSVTLANPAAVELDIHVFADWSSVEVFLGGDAPPISARVFLPEEADQISFGGDGCIVDVKFYELRSTWN